MPAFSSVIVLLLALPIMAFWFTRVTRRALNVAGFTTDLRLDPGERLRKSRYGMAVVNGASITARIEEYAGGYAIRAYPLLGGGCLWMSKEGLRAEAIQGAAPFPLRSRTFRSGDHSVRLFGRLAGFVRD